MNLLGPVSLLVAAFLGALLAIGAAGVAQTHVRAQTAADAAALAAVSAAPFAGGGGDSCAAAARVAEANGALLTACDAPRGGWALRVEVRVGFRAPGLAGILPPLVATAAAELAPAARPRPDPGPRRSTAAHVRHRPRPDPRAPPPRRPPGALTADLR